MPSSRQRQVLFVEDDEATISVTTTMLERLGFSVRTETESLTALKVFSEEPDQFDLAILDHKIDKVMSGLELAERFRHIRRNFPVLLYTGRYDEIRPEQLKLSGIRLVVPKPATAYELAEALEVIFGKGIKSSR